MLCVFTLLKSVDDMSRSTDEALNRQRTIEESGEGGERRQSGHKRSCSDGSRTIHMITLTAGDAEEQKKGMMTTVPHLMKKEEAHNPRHTPRSHKGT